MARRTRKAISSRIDRWAGRAPLRVLVGPYILAEHCAYMAGAFDDFDTLTFGVYEDADVRMEGIYSVEDLLRELPRGWRPDLMLLWRPEYTSLPLGLEESPFPVAMLISDWYLAFTECMDAARFVDLVVTGSRGERAFRAAGFDNVLNMPMLGYQRGFDGAFHADQRDIDVLCAGNPNWAVHRERERVVAELMELPAEVRLVHSPMVGREEYNRLLGRSKIFVNQTVIGEVNMKCYEIPSAGACLFVEEDNLDIRRFLTPDESVVLFNRQNLNQKILYYLAHEDERQAIADAGRAAMQSRSYRDNMRDIVEHLRSIGRDTLMTLGRSIQNQPRARRLACYVGYASRHTGYGLDQVLALADQLADDAHSPRSLLQGVLQYTARSAPYDRRRGRPWAGVWKVAEILDLLHEAWNRRSEDLCLNLAWAQIAREHADAEMARRAIDRLIEQLQTRVTVELGNARLYTLEQRRRFCFERTAWEEIEAGRDPDPALRGLLLEFAFDLRAQLHEHTGHPILAIEDLERARDAAPTSIFARPKLFERLSRYDRRDEAIEVGEEHLVQCPLDTGMRIRLFECELRRGNREAADLHLRRARRIASVFCDEELVSRLDHIASKVGLKREEASVRN